MTAVLRRVLHFWSDVLVGDDWRVAVGVVVVLALTYGMSQTTLPAWWLPPVGVAVVFAVSLWRAVRQSSRAMSRP